MAEELRMALIDVLRKASVEQADFCEKGCACWLRN